MIRKIPLALLSIEDDGYHLIVQAMVNGQPANLLLDTGASKTVFDEVRLTNFMDKKHFVHHDKLSTGLGTNSMESKLAIIDQFEFDGLIISNFETAVLDLTHVNESYEKLNIPAIDGVVGGDLLEQLNALIDYGNKILVLTK